MKSLVCSFLGLYLALFSVPPANASDQPHCAVLEAMLLDTHLKLPQYNAVEFALLDANLKEAYSRQCSTAGGASSGQENSGLYKNGLRMQAAGAWFLPNGQVFEDGFATDAAGQPRILGPFLSAHRSCASGCSYTSWGIWGDKAHQARPSCHNSGEAIDIHAISCGGGTYKALSGRFDQYVDCMRGSLGVIYRSANHFNHAHFQLRNCNMCRGLGCGGNSGGSDPGEEEESEEENEQDNEEEEDEE